MTKTPQLKFHDVVRKGRLDHDSAQYILKHPECLAGMPKAGTQGTHRLFARQQAMNLAICTHVMKMGLTLKMAAMVVAFCQKSIRRLKSPTDRQERQYASDFDDPWILTIVEGRYFRLWRNKLAKDSHLTSEDDFFDVFTKQTEVLGVSGLTETKLNLTKLESFIWGPN